MADYMAAFLTRMKSRTSEIRNEISTATLDAKGSNPLAGHGTPAVGKLQSSMLKFAYDMEPDEVVGQKKKIGDVSDVVSGTSHHVLFINVHMICSKRLQVTAHTMKAHTCTPRVFFYSSMCVSDDHCVFRNSYVRLWKASDEPTAKFRSRSTACAPHSHLLSQTRTRTSFLFGSIHMVPGCHMRVKSAASAVPLPLFILCFLLCHVRPKIDSFGLVLSLSVSISLV
jgi:hypothetical protein